MGGGPCVSDLLQRPQTRNAHPAEQSVRFIPQIARWTSCIFAVATATAGVLGHKQRVGLSPRTSLRFIVPKIRQIDI